MLHMGGRRRRTRAAPPRWSISRSPDTWVMIARPSAPTCTAVGSPGSVGAGGAKSVQAIVDYCWERLADDLHLATALFDGLVLGAFRGKRLLRGPELARAPVTVSHPLGATQHDHRHHERDRDPRVMALLPPCFATYQRDIGSGLGPRCAGSAPHSSWARVSTSRTAGDWLPPTGGRAPAHRAFRRHRSRLSHRLERRRCGCETDVCDTLRPGTGSADGPGGD
jgi:hypothetical protein